MIPRAKGICRKSIHSRVPEYRIAYNWIQVNINPYRSMKTNINRNTNNYKYIFPICLHKGIRHMSISLMRALEYVSKYDGNTNMSNMISRRICRSQQELQQKYVQEPGPHSSDASGIHAQYPHSRQYPVRKRCTHHRACMGLWIERKLPTTHGMEKCPPVGVGVVVVVWVLTNLSA